MANERERVIVDLLRRLKACGIHPDEPFEATWDGREWTFSQSEAGSALTGGAHGVEASTGVRPQSR